MERTKLQRALIEVRNVHKHLQYIADLQPTIEVITLICECVRLERKLALLLDFDTAVKSEAVWQERQDAMRQAKNLQEALAVSHKYKIPLHYNKRYS